MSSRTRPPWSKKPRRIIGRRLRLESLVPEAGCAPTLRRGAPIDPTAFLTTGRSGAADVSRADRRTCWELEQFMGKCYRSGDPEDALDLFDELLPAARPSSIDALSQLLTTVAHAPVLSTVRNGPALAVSMFNRMARAGTKKKVAPNIVTYNILINCCCDAGCLNLGFASLGQLFKTGLRADAIITFTPLLSTLCAEERTGDAMNIAAPVFSPATHFSKGYVLRRVVKRLSI